MTRHEVYKHLTNLPGWTSQRRLMVIESDDWGSIRMPSADVFNQLLKSGFDLGEDEGSRYNKYDAIATHADLTDMFEVLNSIKDQSGRNAVMTPVAVTANPDFKKIRDHNFTEYFFEPVTDTMRRFPGCKDVFPLWKEGIEKRLFVPQFHGREHLNVMAWMRALALQHKRTLIAFNHGFWGISTAGDPDIGLEFQAAFDFVDPTDIAYQKKVIKSGLHLFKDLFGYRARYFVPPNGPFSSALEAVCYEEGIRYLFNTQLKREPIGAGKVRKKLHWLGRKSKSGLVSITRNCFFEPGDTGKDWVDWCLKDISIAFRWNKPAVISTHRVNYIGALHQKNRENGLKQLKLLLKKVIRHWPEVEFITTEELGETISNE